MDEIVTLKNVCTPPVWRQNTGLLQQTCLVILIKINYKKFQSTKRFSIVVNKIV